MKGGLRRPGVRVERLGLRIEPALKERLIDMAASRGLSLSKLVLDILADAVSRRTDQAPVENPGPIETKNEHGFRSCP